MKTSVKIFTAWIAFAGLMLTATTVAGPAQSGRNITAEFTDAKFLAEVRKALGKGANAPILNTDNFASVTCLNLFGKDIASLAGIGRFVALTKLDCNSNNLTSLPALPSALKELYCSANQLASLPALPSGLTELHCYENRLASLPALPASLKELYCSDNRLTVLPALPSGLATLHCEENQLTSLPALPSGLTVLHCYDNRLTSLPELPSGLIEFYPHNSDSNEASDPDAYTLSDGGAVLRGNSIVADGDVHEVDAGSVRNWVVLSEDEETGVEATGIFFFGEDGKCVGFLQLESEYECQEIFFRPDGEYFVLVTGSEIRTDMFFNVYRFADMEKTAELAGIRGSFAWVDGVRFLFTRIDDTREGGSSPGYAYSFRVSAVMYDTAISEEIVLKQATDKQNFRIGEVSADGTSVTVTEEFVKSEKDWGNGDKIKKREIKVEIPAAG